MKNYSSNNAQKGKLAYRTPSRFIYKKCLEAQKISCQAGIPGGGKNQKTRPGWKGLPKK